MSEPTTNISSRSCAKCGKTYTDANITKNGNSDPDKSSYNIWHKNPEISGTWICAGCYVIRYYVPKKIKTKQERYDDISKLFNGKVYPMYDEHVNIGRTHTSERPSEEHEFMVDSVAGDTTRLYWKKGNDLKHGNMEDLFISYSSASEEEKKCYKVLSVRRNPKTRVPPTKKPVLSANKAEVYYSDIKDVLYNGIRPVWKVTLHNGKTIEVTEDHSLFCAQAYQVGFNSKLIFDLEKNDMIISIDNYDFNIASKLQFDNDKLTFMGLWVADGSYNKDKNKHLTGVSISTGHEQNVISWLNHFALKYPNCRATESNCQLLLWHSDKGDLRIHRRQLVKEIHSIFGEVDCYTKRVPKFLFVASNEEIASFLRGYFSGDGSVHICNNNVNLPNYKYGTYYAVDCSSVNRELLEDISVLLDRLGIKHNITTPSKYGPTSFASSRKVCYKLIIHASPSVDKFMNMVGFIKKHSYTKRIVYQRDKKLRPVSLRGIRHVEYIGPKPVYSIYVRETEAFIANGIVTPHSTSLWR